MREVLAIAIHQMALKQNFFSIKFGAILNTHA
jgi:hypothetical protein